MLRISGGQPQADVPGHDGGILGGQPDMGVVLMMVLVFAVVMGFMVVVIPFQKKDPLRGVNGLGRVQNVLHERFQPAAGDDDGVSPFGLLYLIDIQRVVMQTGDGLCDQPPHGQSRSLAQCLGEFIDRQGGGRNVRGRCFCPAACKEQGANQKNGYDFFHGLHLIIENIYQ